MSRTPRRTSKADWADRFFKAFAEEATIAAACAKAKVGRTTVHDRRKRDPVFAQRFLDADEAITEAMEAELYRRAVHGVEQPVFQNGKLVGTVRKFSDVLLIFGLKARRPDIYRDRISIEDERKTQDREAANRLTDAELDEKLAGVEAGDNVTPIAAASGNGRRRR